MDKAQMVQQAIQDAADGLKETLPGGSYHASSYLAQIIREDDPNLGALFWFAQALAKQMGEREHNWVYRCMIQAAKDYGAKANV